MLWDDERLEGARPRSWRRRRYGWGGCAEEDGVGGVCVEVRWWWARRDEMAGPREEDEVESGFWGDGILCAEALGSGSFSSEVDRG